MIDRLRSEIIHILITEWEATEAQAVNLISDVRVFETFAASRRKRRFMRALGKVDQFTPCFPLVSPGEVQMFASDEAVAYWLSRQTRDAETPAINKRRNRRASHSSGARQRRQFAHAACL